MRANRVGMAPAQFYQLEKTLNAKYGLTVEAYLQLKAYAESYGLTWHQYIPYYMKGYKDGNQVRQAYGLRPVQTNNCSSGNCNVGSPEEDLGVVDMTEVVTVKDESTPKIKRIPPQGSKKSVRKVNVPDFGPPSLNPSGNMPFEESQNQFNQSGSGTIIDIGEGLDVPPPPPQNMQQTPQQMIAENPQVVPQELTEQQKLEIIKSKSYVDYGLIAAIVDNNMQEIPKLAEAGINFFKIYMDVAKGGVLALNDGGMLEAFRLVAEIGRRIGIHAENNSIMDFFTTKLKEEGRTDALAHLESHPSVAEAEAISRTILFAKETCCKLHIHHMSSKDGIELVKESKVKGIDVSTEACPHHLLLNSENYRKLGSILKINPPVRYAENGEALWEGLKDGAVEVIATDHSPHTEEEKIKDNIWEAMSGFPGVETSVPLMLTQVNEGRISLNQYVKLVSENPARLFNMYPQKGSFNIGTDADFTIVDMEKESVIDKNRLHSKTKITPFDGYKVKGVPVFTIVRGNVVMKDGRIIGEPQGRKIDPIV